MTDGELVRQALAGRMSAREELARRWAPRVLAVCQARVGRVAAEDLAQDAVLRALRSLHQLSDGERFGPWIRSIAVRVCLDWLRRKPLMERSWSSLPDAVAAVSQPLVDGDAALERQEEHERLWAAVGELPEDLREVLLLFYCDCMSYDDMSSVLEVSRATVNGRLARARDHLRRTLDPDRECCHGLCQRS
ncbi:MAG: sigma-70 family RNA polymerase sigma factor [Planctomyces sp.]|nr:sigma-70 family RNA polymerase sigma factor [Planctomyces sp.]